MNSLVFLNEDGHGNIYQEDSLEAMDIVDEEGDSHSVRQLVNLESYLKKNSNPVTIEKLDEQDHEKYFFYKIQQLLSIRAAALKAGVKESTARNWWRKYEEDPDTFVLALLNEEHKQHLIEFFDENPQAFIRDAVEELDTYLSLLKD
ncbi:hypothetical protein BD408DRAFT_432400 [Parasitella parasitica]|nr:hypothetical protein BD408DRAFT_432400 [Parasitella parasitica]